VCQKFPFFYSFQVLELGYSFSTNTIVTENNIDFPEAIFVSTTGNISKLTSHLVYNQVVSQYQLLFTATCVG